MDNLYTINQQFKKVKLKDGQKKPGKIIKIINTKNFKKIKAYFRIIISIFILFLFWHSLIITINKYKKNKTQTKKKISKISNNLNSLQICVSTIGKMENYIAKDFVEWHKRIGVDKIYIYDNNEIDGERFDEVLKEYIDDELVEIIDKRGNHIPNRHINVLNEHYKKYNNQCDWIIYIDLDELIYIKNKKTLREYLTDVKFSKCQIIKLFWEIHGDNDQLNYEEKWMWERFPQPSKFQTPSFKSFVRGNLTGINFIDVHQPWINSPENERYIACNSVGNKTILNVGYIYKKDHINEVSRDEAVILHYQFRSTEEFCRKITKRKYTENRGFTKEIYRTTYVEKYFTHNKITKEKINMIEKCLEDKIDDKFKKNIE